MSFDLSVIPNKNILLAVTGGIAAYKSAILVRRLKDAGFQVRVVMTEGAQAFITPLTFQALSGNPVHTELLDPLTEAPSTVSTEQLSELALISTVKQSDT